MDSRILLSSLSFIAQINPRLHFLPSCPMRYLDTRAERSLQAMRHLDGSHPPRCSHVDHWSPSQWPRSHLSSTIWLWELMLHDSLLIAQLSLRKWIVLNILRTNCVRARRPPDTRSHVVRFIHCFIILNSGYKITVLCWVRSSSHYLFVLETALHPVSMDVSSFTCDISTSFLTAGFLADFPLRSSSYRFSGPIGMALRVC